MINVCFATGMADFLPDAQEYHTFDTVEGLKQEIIRQCQYFQAEACETGHYQHDIPGHVFAGIRHSGECSSLNQRLCITVGDTDRVLDVIGMTDNEYNQQSGE